MFVNLDCCSPAAERRDEEDGAAQGEPAADGRSSEEEKRGDTVALEAGERSSLGNVALTGRLEGGKKRKERKDGS